MSTKASLLALSILLQCIVIGFSMRQVWRRQAPAAWILVAGAFIIMLSRRVMSFVSTLNPQISPLSALEGELLGISVSVLLLAALILIHPRLEKGRLAEEALKSRLEEQARQAQALREAVRVRDTFLQVASHELKTPLTPMIIKLQALAKSANNQQQTPFVHQVQSYADTGLRQMHRLSSLVSDLLDVSRIESGRMTLDKAPVDLAALVREVAARFDGEAHRVGSPLRTETPEHLKVESDGTRLDQVVTNLLENAVKYGGGKLIEVSLKAFPHKAVLSVRDQGIGIPPDQLSRIFGRFERAVSERNYGGMGLGLYISKLVVEALGGTIQAESQVGQGTTFTVELPQPA